MCLHLLHHFLKQCFLVTFFFRIGDYHFKYKIKFKKNINFYVEKYFPYDLGAPFSSSTRWHKPRILSIEVLRLLKTANASNSEVNFLNLISST